MAASLRLLSRGMAPVVAGRALHSSCSAQAISKFTMPAMSPTMTEGGLASWKVKEGDKFAAGDVLLEIETDKATMDVEAQEDGVMAKILVNDGAKAVPVGKAIAMLAEEGDDISSVEAPAEEETKSASPSSPPPSSPSSSTSSSTPSPPPTSSEAKQSVEPKHAPQTGKPLMPSVLRLLADFNVSDDKAKSIKGTGMRGMLTKGDVLAYLGKAQSPTGTYKEDKRGISGQAGPAAAKAEKKSEPLTADSLRAMIFAGLASSSHASRSKVSAASSPNLTARSAKGAFDELLDDYEFRAAAPAAKQGATAKDPFKGLM